MLLYISADEVSRMNSDLTYEQSKKLLNVTIREYDEVIMHLAAQVLDGFAFTPLG